MADDFASHEVPKHRTGLHPAVARPFILVANSRVWSAAIRCPAQRQIAIPEWAGAEFARDEQRWQDHGGEHPFRNQLDTARLL